MDEVLLRRLLGALVLFGGLFLLSGLLPDADAPGPVAQGHKQRVQIDLLPKPEAPPRVAPQPAVVDQDEPETERKPVPEAKPKPQSKPRSNPPSKAAPPAARPEPKPAPAAEQWWVQVASFSSQDNADALVSELRGRGLKAVLETVQVGGRQVSRVLLGPYSNQQSAEAARSSIILSGFADARSFAR